MLTIRAVSSARLGLLRIARDLGSSVRLPGFAGSRAGPAGGIAEVFRRPKREGKGDATMAERKDQPDFMALIERQVLAWSAVSLPNPAAAEMAQQLSSLIRGFEDLRGTLQFEDEPSSFEAALQAAKEQ
jgi:hypothetical protein